LIYVKGISKGLLRLVSIAVILALVLTSTYTAIAKADNPTWTQTSQADFNTGTLFQVDTAISPGDVKLALNPAGEQLDQNNPNHTNDWHNIKDTEYQAQTFVAGLTGNLTKIALYLKKENNPGQLTIEIRDCAGATSPPGNTILASMTSSAVVSTCGQEYQFTFPSPTTVTTGTYYAIVLHEPTGVGGSHDKYHWAEDKLDSDLYPSGIVWKSSDSGGSWSMGGGGLHDFYFKTYVSGAQYYSPGTLTSSVKDCGSTSTITQVSWGETLNGQTINLQIRSDDAADMSSPNPWETVTNGDTTISTPANRYIQYKATLATSNVSVTPVLHDVTISYTAGANTPTVTTNSATLVEENTATVNGVLTDDGGSTCQFQFQYGTTSGGPYPNSTGWTGSISTGQSFLVNLTSLSEGTRYYFIAQAKNASATGSGSEQSFLTKPDPPYNFTATAVGDTQINLSWTKGDGAQRTYIVRKTDSYPTSRGDGTQVYFDTGTSFSDTGLASGTTYYYSAWSEVTGSQQWSDNYAQASDTTTGGVVPPPPTASVGGEIRPVNTLRVLAPWLGLMLMLSLIAARGYLAFKMTQH